MREKLLKELIEKSKSTPVSFIGVDVKKFNLTSEEKRWLVNQGLYLFISRDKLILIYPSYKRAEDLRNKVLNRRERWIKKQFLELKL